MNPGKADLTAILDMLAAVYGEDVLREAASERQGEKVTGRKPRQPQDPLKHPDRLVVALTIFAQSMGYTAEKAAMLGIVLFNPRGTVNAISRDGFAGGISRLLPPTPGRDSRINYIQQKAAAREATAFRKRVGLGKFSKTEEHYYSRMGEAFALLFLGKMPETIPMAAAIFAELGEGPLAERVAALTVEIPRG